MKRFLFCLLLASIQFLLAGTNAFALKYASIASGSFSSPATWLGGIIPPVNFNTGDTILIDIGHNVVLDQDIILSQQNALLNVQGILRSSGNEHINFNGSSALSVSGTLDIDSITLANVTNASVAGQLKAKKMRCNIFSVSGQGDVIISERLYIYGSLSNTGGNTISVLPNAVIYMLGGQIIASGTGIFTLPSVYDVVYTNSAHIQPTGIEITGSGLRHITVDLQSDTSELKLGSGLIVGNGTLHLQKGILALNNNSISIGNNGDLTGSGKIKSTSSSDVGIYATGGISGQLQFVNTGNTVRDLVINTNSTVILNSALKVTGKVDFQNGKLDVGANKLSLITGATVAGADVNKYIITGTGGSLAADIGSGASFTYHVGTASQYAPCRISSNNNTVYNGMSVGVNPGVKVFGTSGNDMAATQPMINATWFVEHSNSMVDIDMEVMWTAAMEVNSFNRGNAYISHLIGNYWDKSPKKPANLNANGLYSIERESITSLSPFAVFDNATVDVPGIEQSEELVQFYPNPAKDVLNINISQPSKAMIYNTTGQLVQTVLLSSGITPVNISALHSGVYYIQLNGKNVESTFKFVKQ
jgi:hypothetical protein